MARPVIKRGPEITPHRRAVIVAYRTLDQPLSFKKISEKTGVAESTASGIFRHAVKNATLKRQEKDADLLSVPQVPSEIDLTNDSTSHVSLRQSNISLPVPAHDAEPLPLNSLVKELSLLELVSKDCLDSDARSGRPKALSEEEKDLLVATVKRDFKTRRMKLPELRYEAGLSHVCDKTIHNALRERGIKAYREEFKFILTPENKAVRLAYCTARQTWTVDCEWANYGFTDEMSIEIGANWEECTVWREENER